MNFDDEKILELYIERNEDAIEQTQMRYGSYLLSLARSVTGSEQDAEECVNDTYLRAWNSIPPAHPIPLRPYLARVTRNLALDRVSRESAQKRGGGELTMMLSELSEVLEDSVAEQTEEGAIGTVIDAFLRELPKIDRVVFVRRYFYGCSIAEISKECGVSNSKIKSMLHRTRKKLRVRLQKEGIII